MADTPVAPLPATSMLTSYVPCTVVAVRRVVHGACVKEMLQLTAALYCRHCREPYVSHHLPVLLSGAATLYIR